MACWICRRQSRGFAYTDGRYPLIDPRRYPLHWVFCSRRCQDAFRVYYRVRIEAPESEGVVQNITDTEHATLRTCLKAFGNAAATIGFDKPLGAYSEAEALQVIDAVVACFTEAMVAHHEATRHPPIWGLQPTLTDPFADLQDDLPPLEPRS